MSNNLFRITEKILYRTVKYFILSALILTSGMIVLSNSAVAQTTETKPQPVSETKAIKPGFKNQSEQEDYWAEELFKSDYKKEHYKKYKGRIITNGNSYSYSGKVMSVYITPELKSIFEKGFFYPAIIAESFKYRPQIKIGLMKDTIKAALDKDTIMTMQKFGYDKRPDSLEIYDLEELKFLETEPTKKRFRFWLEVRYPTSNPIVCFMELTNENATSLTDIITFINGAKLTFFEEGWSII